MEIDNVSTQWLSWTHVPIVLRGHYELWDYDITWLQDEATRLFKMKGDISKCAIWVERALMILFGSIVDIGLLIWWLQFDYNDLRMTTTVFMIMTDMSMNNILMPRFNSLRLASTGFTSWVDYYQWHSSPGLCVLPLIERMFSLRVGSLTILNSRGPNESW